MMDETQMIELLKVVQTNPELAAKILAQSGLTPEQVFSAGSPQLGGMVNPATAVPPGAMPGGITNTDNGTYSAGFSGPVVPPQPPAQQFSPPETPTNVVPFQTAELGPLPNMQPDGTAVAGATQRGPMTVADVGMGSWAPTVMPAAGPAADPSLAGLMQGIQGFGKMAPTASADQKPIFGANAPAPRAPTAIGAPASMQALMALLQGQAGPQVPPSLGMLMSRRA